MCEIRTFLNVSTMGVSGENETDEQSGPLGQGTSETREWKVGYPFRDDIHWHLGVTFILLSFSAFRLNALNQVTFADGYLRANLMG